MRKISLQVFVAVLGIGCFTALSHAEVRDWTQADKGRTISGEFVSMKDATTAKIKSVSGEIFEIQINSFSAVDQAYVNSQISQNAPVDVKKGEAITVTLSDVHLCCRGCSEAAEEGAGGPLPNGVSIKADRDEGTVKVTANSKEDMEAALNSVYAAGFYGESDNPDLGIKALEKNDTKVDSLELDGLHLCCKKCVRPFLEAVKSVKGVENCTAATDDTSTTITGKGFSTYEVLQAIRKAGYGAQVVSK